MRFALQAVLATSLASFSVDLEDEMMDSGNARPPESANINLAKKEWTCHYPRCSTKAFSRLADLDRHVQKLHIASSVRPATLANTAIRQRPSSYYTANLSQTDARNKQKPPLCSFDFGRRPDPLQSIQLHDHPHRALTARDRKVQEQFRGSHKRVVIVSGYGRPVVVSHMARSEDICRLEQGKEKWPAGYPSSTQEASGESRSSGVWATKVQAENYEGNRRAFATKDTGGYRRETWSNNGCEDTLICSRDVDPIGSVSRDTPVEALGETKGNPVAECQPSDLCGNYLTSGFQGDHEYQIQIALLVSRVFFRAVCTSLEMLGHFAAYGLMVSENKQVMRSSRLLKQSTYESEFSDMVSDDIIDNVNSKIQVKEFSRHRSFSDETKGLRLVDLASARAPATLLCISTDVET